MPGLHALGASLELLLGIGVESISARLLEIVEALTDALTEIGAIIVGPQEVDRRSGIISFDLPGQSLTALRKQCLEAGIVVNLRGGRLRVSPHAYTNRGRRGSVDCSPQRLLSSA